jgi:CRP-like cAMP-binding protein
MTTKMENISQEKIIEVLKKIPFFREFTDGELSLLLKITQWIRFQPGDIIIKEGASEKNFSIILKGMCLQKEDRARGL